MLTGKETEWIDQSQNQGLIDIDFRDWLTLNIQEAGIKPNTQFKDYCSTDCVKDYLDNKTK